MEQNEILIKSNRESDKYIIRGLMLSSALCFLDFIFVLIEKKLKLIPTDFGILLVALICLFAIFIHKKNPESRAFQPFILGTMELISTMLFIAGWVYSAPVLVLTFLVMSLYLNPKYMKIILAIKIPLLIIAVAISITAFPDYVLPMTPGVGVQIVIFYTLQIGLFAFLFYLLSKKTSRLLDNFIESNGETEKLLSSAMEGVRAIDISVGELLLEVKKNHEFVDNINDKAKTVKDSSQSLSEKALESRESIEDIFTGINETAENSNNISLLTEDMSELTAKNSENMELLLEKINEITVASKESRESFDTLLKSTEDISTAIELIDSISKQTNLLSLNASIEAARAGEAGRGFAVVASEIQQLADQTSKSAGEIAGIIETMNKSSDEYLKSVDHTETVIGENVAIINKVREDFEVMKQTQDSVKEKISESKDSIALLKGKVNEIQEIIKDTYSKSQITSDEVNDISSILEELKTSFESIQNSAEDIKTSSDNMVDNGEAE